MTGRILVVEDEEHLAFALEFNLQAEGYQVRIAPDVASARDALEASHDLIVLDVMLPDGDGFEFCKEIRTAGNTTPILFLTAKGSLDDIVSGLEAGGDDYMAKPFALAELLVRVNALLRRSAWRYSDPPQPHSNSEFQFGEHSVCFETREASAWGRPVTLTDLELRILKYFADNPRRIVGRQELLEKVWGVSPESNTRTVDVFIARMRRMFERDPASPKHFETVRGAGYRFVPDP